jgi:hypothetical protein
VYQVDTPAALARSLLDVPVTHAGAFRARRHDEGGRCSIEAIDMHRSGESGGSAQRHRARPSRVRASFTA